MSKRYPAPTWVVNSADQKCDVDWECSGSLMSLVCDLINPDDKGFDRLVRAREVRCRRHRTSTTGTPGDCRHNEVCKANGYDEIGNKATKWECKCKKGCLRDDQD